VNLATRMAATKAIKGGTRTDRAVSACHLAKELEKAGEYEAACDALAEFWPDKSGLPIVERLDPHAMAELMLRAGALSGWLGSAHQANGQERAKDFITRSMETYARLGVVERVAEARSDLALCYMREGGFDEARIIFDEALTDLNGENVGLRATILIRAGIVEERAGRFSEALLRYKESMSLVEAGCEDALKGSLYLNLGNVYTRLADAEGRDDYRDLALLQYTSASVHFEQAGHTRQCGRVENNLGYLYQTIGRFPEAHQHISRAREIFLSLGDQGHVAQVDDTRARALLAEGRYRQAERYARTAVRTLDRGDECNLLVEALTTHGVTLARLGYSSSARAKLNRAIEVGENCGDLVGASRAKLSIIEELSGQTPVTELTSIYVSAAELLQKSQDPSATQRLIDAAATVINTLLDRQAQAPSLDVKSWDDFSLKKEVHAFERNLLESALRDAGGSVTTASRMLGFRHHQSLISLINTRHRELLNARSAVRKRRQPILPKPEQVGRSRRSSKAKTEAGQISVLHIEDNKEVANVISDYLRAAGMEVDTYGNGLTALKILTSDTYYDVLIVDHDLPGLSGLELVRRARKINHRRNTPIIMFSGDDVEREAWRAGVQEFLRKPQDIDRVASTVERLMKEKDKVA
jgi:CheY-like chemotaxis protein/tetratricopeptide (TPR) repeat protein